MDFIVSDETAVEMIETKVNDVAVKALSVFELALIGGGCGEVVFG